MNIFGRIYIKRYEKEFHNMCLYEAIEYIESYKTKRNISIEELDILIDKVYNQLFMVLKSKKFKMFKNIVKCKLENEIESILNEYDIHIDKRKETIETSDVEKDFFKIIILPILIIEGLAIIFIAYSYITKPTLVKTEYFEDNQATYTKFIDNSKGSDELELDTICSVIHVPDSYIYNAKWKEGESVTVKFAKDYYYDGHTQLRAYEIIEN